MMALVMMLEIMIGAIMAQRARQAAAQRAVYILALIAGGII